MTRGMKALKSKHFVLSVYAIRFDGTEYHVSTIRNWDDFDAPDVKNELEEAKEDTSVERIEVYRSRKCRRCDGTKRIIVGKPTAVIMC